MTGDPAPEAPPAAHLHPHVVPLGHAITWFEEALRLFKRGPGTWALLAVVTMLSELAFDFLPDPWPLLSTIVAPLVGCGLLLASAAADRHVALRLRFAWTAFRAPAHAVLAIVLASLVTWGAEAFAAWWIADANLLVAHGDADDLTLAARLGIYAIGVLASLPVTFVPFHVLFEPVGLGEAFAASWHAFVLNTGPLLVYAGVSLLLLAFGILTMSLGLVIVLPLWAASSYVAWRDVFGIAEPPEL